MQRSILVLSVICCACRVEQPPLADVQPQAELRVADVETEPEPPQLLDPDALVYLPTPGNGLFQLYHEQPSLALIIDVELNDEARAELAEQLAEGQRHALLSAEQAQRLGLERPQQVWMFGESGPCEAKLGSPYAIAEAEGPLVLELGYEVEPCAEDFAPVAQLGASPAALTWRDVDCSPAVQVEEPDAWAHPQRAAYEQLGMFDWQPSDEHPSKPEQMWIKSCAVEPAIVELAWSWVWPEQPCWQAEYVSRELGWWRDGALELLPRLELGETPELIGALMADDEPIAIFASGWPELYVGMRTGEGFRWTAKIVGDFHDEVVAARDSWSVLDCDDDP